MLHRIPTSTENPRFLSVTVLKMYSIFKQVLIGEIGNRIVTTVHVDPISFSLIMQGMYAYDTILINRENRNSTQCVIKPEGGGGSAMYF